MNKVVASGTGEDGGKTLDDLSRTSLCVKDQRMGLEPNHKCLREPAAKTNVK